jgi:ATP-binding cassette subfamily B protein
MSEQQKQPQMGRGAMGNPGARFAPGQKAKDARGTLRRVIVLYKNQKGALAVILSLTVLSAVVQVLVPYWTGRAFNAFAGSKLDGDLLMKCLTAIVLLNLTSYAAGTACDTLMLKASQRLVRSLRGAFFEKLQHLPLRFFDTHAHGDTMSRLSSDVDNISQTIAQSTTQVLSSILSLTGSLIVMVTLNVPLTLVTLISVPLVALLTRTISKRSRAHFLAQQRALGALNGVVEETVTGMRMVKAFGRQGEVLEELNGINERLYESGYRAQLWSGLMMPLVNVIGNLSFALVSIAGGWLSVTSGLSVGAVISFLSYSKQFARPLNAVAGLFATIQSALAGAERVFEVLDEAEEPADAPGAKDLMNPEGGVEFDDVCFSYDGARPVLDQVCFSVPAGQTCALVGETGSGKTTIVNLLTRFYDPDSGFIRIDGQDILSVTRESLRRVFSVVLQDTCLFTGTILDNIRYARPGATEDEVIQAAKLARAHGFIERLPAGYQTQLSGNADQISEGQRQLLAIARAVLCESRILILDEATSSVDTKTEKDIQRAMLGLMKGRTSFLIAHRLSTIRDADQILVLSGGRIVERGNHASLMSQKGHYYQMVVSQMGLAEEA